MIVDPKLKGLDRIGNLVAGIAVVLVGIFFIDKQWLQVVMIILGALLVIGAIGGT